MATCRLFVAVDVSPEARRALDEGLRHARRVAQDARWSPPDRWHLTLQFLGQVEAARLPELSRALEQAALAQGPFPLTVSGAGTFGRAPSPSILWAGVVTGERELSRLARAVGEAFAPLGFPPEARPFTPHLTLARARDARRGEPHLHAAAESLRALACPPCTVDRLVLYESTADGAYVPRSAARLPAHRFVPHTAEVKVELEASSEEGLFVAATSAFAELVSGLRRVEGPTQTREVWVQGQDRVAQLVALVDELVFLSETVPGIPARCRVRALDGNGLRAEIDVVPADGLETPVKAATLHGARCEQDAEGTWRGALVLDV